MAASLIDPVGDAVGDGCTGFPNGTWRYCCDLHDIAYSLGPDKLRADWDLFMCVAPHDPIAALIMLAGVTVLGWLWWWRARVNSPSNSWTLTTIKH